MMKLMHWHRLVGFVVDVPYGQANALPHDVAGQTHLPWQAHQPIRVLPYASTSG